MTASSHHSDEHQQPLEQIVAQVATLGFCLPGSAAEPHIRCPNAGCHCHAGPTQLHSPYIAWTQRSNQKTLARNLTPKRAGRYRSWLEHNHRLHELSTEFQRRSLQAAAEANGWGEK
ncbi:DUF6788 family protein [Conexibacter sp. S30A1]|uniref:DUF6788 family protein n=1 Tax=Conexibacter sp. S30A1 TaxID=2937800 RepID=UPI003530DF8A